MFITTQIVATEICVNCGGRITKANRDFPWAHDGGRIYCEYVVGRKDTKATPR